jgi:hypothetical protein
VAQAAGTIISQAFRAGPVIAATIIGAPWNRNHSRGLCIDFRPARSGSGYAGALGPQGTLTHRCPPRTGASAPHHPLPP